MPPEYPEPVGPAMTGFGPIQTDHFTPGDSLSVVLSRLGLPSSEQTEVVKALGALVNLRHFRPGQALSLRKNDQGQFSHLRFEASESERYVVFRDLDDRLVGYRQDLPLKVKAVWVEGEVEASLSSTIQRLGESAWLTLTLVDVFSWDIDFFTETRPHDRFRVLVEKIYLDGNFLRYGHVLAAEYQLASGRRHEAFRYSFENGRSGYYTSDGQAVEKAFLKSPVKFASITSGYGMRRHPVLHYTRAHKGVDYGAPRGTAIWAMADGVVRSAGWAGGYGRMVALSHANGIQTRYAHLSGFGPRIKRGARVHQKQVVGYVGDSGLATGPHLHFEVLVNGRHTNPLNLVVPPAPPISKAEFPRFEAQTAPLQAAMKARQALSEPAPDR